MTENGRPITDLARAVGERLRAAREGAGLSQDELAHAIGYKAPMISAFEGGRRRLKVEDLDALCRVLQKPPSYFLPDAGDVGGRRDTAVDSPSRVGVTLRAELANLPGTVTDRIVGFLDYAEVEADDGRTVPDLHDLAPHAAARKVLQLCEIKEPPVMLGAVCQRLGISVIEWDFPDALSALIARTHGGGYVIGVNKTHARNRRRFSVAHEIGHAVLRHEAAYYLEIADQSAFGDPPGYRYLDERAGNTFAASLLMDERWLRRDFKKVPFSVKLAKQYKVSEEAMSFRLLNLELV